VIAVFHLGREATYTIFDSDLRYAPTPVAKKLTSEKTNQEADFELPVLEVPRPVLKQGRPSPTGA